MGLSRRALCLLLFLGVAWGLPYLLIKVAVREFEPATLVLVRSVVGAVLLCPAALRRPLGRVSKSQAAWVAAFAFVEIAGPYLLLADAERSLPSTTTAVVVALTPAVAFAISACMGDRRHVRAAQLLGLVTGAAGVAAVAGGAGPSAGPLALGEAFLAVVGYAAGPQIAARRLQGLPGPALAAVSLALTAVVFSPAAARWPAHPTSGPVLAALGLASLCTAAALAALFALISEIGPARPAVITYINPAVAALAGVLVLGEPMTVPLGCGMLAIVAGSWLTASDPLTRSRSPLAPGAMEALPRG